MSSEGFAATAEANLADTDRGIAWQLLDELWRTLSPTALASDAVFETLREGILRGVLPVGHRMSEDDLAARFAVSRTPIREAILRLESEALIERSARRGIAVSRVTEEEIQEVYATRAALDGLAAGLAARSASSADISRLWMLNRELERVVQIGGLSRDISVLAIEFHESIAQASRNALLRHFLTQIHTRLRRFGGTTLKHEERARQAISEHDQIIRAVEGRDEQMAEALAREHVNKTTEARIAASLIASEGQLPTR